MEGVQVAGAPAGLPGRPCEWGGGVREEGASGTQRVLPSHLSQQQLMNSGVAAAPWWAVTIGTGFIIITLKG